MNCIYSTPHRLQPEGPKLFSASDGEKGLPSGTDLARKKFCIV